MKFEMKKELITKALEASDLIWAGWHRSDVCIAACRILQLALRECGVKLEPIVVRVRALNRQMRDAVESGLLDTFKTEDEQRQWMAESGAYGVGLGYEPVTVMLGFEPRPKGKWGAHLALVDRENNLLIDPTLGQASRPEKGLPLPQSILGDISPEVMEGKLDGGIEFSNGVIAVYCLSPSAAGSWLVSPDWTDKRRHKRQIKRILRAMR